MQWSGDQHSVESQTGIGQMGQKLSACMSRRSPKTTQVFHEQWPETFLVLRTYLPGSCHVWNNYQDITLLAWWRFQEKTVKFRYHSTQQTLYLRFTKISGFHGRTVVVNPTSHTLNQYVRTAYRKAVRGSTCGIVSKDKQGSFETLIS